jgi:hypothetical protein
MIYTSVHTTLSFPTASPYYNHCFHCSVLNDHYLLRNRMRMNPFHRGYEKPHRAFLAYQTA